jgi:type II secretion system protein N
MAEAEVAPLFGLRGTRRALAIGVAALALTSIFFVTGFPYDRLAPRAAATIESATGARVAIGQLDLVFSWFVPQLKATDVDITWPGGQHASLQSILVNPAWSLSWLRGRPALGVSLRSQLGDLDGTVALGAAPSFRGELQNVSLALLPVQDIAAGTKFDGRVDAQIDVQLAEAGPQGTVHFDAKQGSLTLPMLPIGVPFDSLRGDVAVGGDMLAKLNGLDLAGPLVGLTASGTIGHSPAIHLAPLALKARIEAREPALRSMLQSQGVALDPGGAAELEIGGTLASPQIVPTRGAGRAG